jgi:CubicO group peptidase (beta-lactamase class C family)
MRMNTRLGWQGRACLVGVLIGLAVLAASPSIVGAAAGDEDAVEALRGMMRKWIRQYDVPAASAALMKPGLAIRKFRYGMLATDPTRIASLSKAITAVCIGRLIDDGRLSFTTPVKSVLKEGFKPTDPRFGSATIEQLLTHTAGLAREPRMRLKFGDLATAFKAVLATPLDGDPGGEYAYSNIGYLTLGVIVETITGHGYEQQCRRTALEPLGASGSIDPELRHRMPNGGWQVSAVDYLKFMQVWGADARVLGPTSRKWLDARTGERESVYALGIRMERTSTGIRYSHGGRVAHEDRGGSYAVKFGDGLTVVVLYEGEIGRQGRRALPVLVNETFAAD